MRYLTIKDIYTVVNKDMLRNLSEDDLTEFDNYEESAISIVDSKIGRSYILSNEWSKTGFDRSPVILRIVKDIFVYDYFTSSRQDKMSELRVKRYEEALKTLDNISKGIDKPGNLVDRDIKSDPDASANIMCYNGVRRLNNIY